MTSIYSARWVLPIASPAIEFAAVATEGARIVGVGDALDIVSRFPHAAVADFGTSVILPGLVNAHSHLELTVMRGFLEREEPDFFAWLRKLTIARMAMTGDDLFVSAMCGAIEAARAGITCVGDSSSVATQSMKALREVGLRGIVYQESFGPDPSLAETNVAQLRRQLEEMRTLESALVHAGVSPHAPYTVSARQLEMISRLTINEKLPLMMHAAESEAERSFMLDGAGPFAEGLRGRGIDWQAPGISTIQYLARHGVLRTKPLLAHCITVDDEDIETIRAAAAAVAHCPKSNAKLCHGRAPFAKFINAGLKVGLGSDSVASNNNCDILEEARFATLLARVSAARGGSPTVRKGVLNTDALADARATAPISAQQALFAATLGGARALGLEDQIGALAEGKQADLIVVGLDAAHQQPVTDPTDALIFSSSGRDVRMTMVAGKEIYREGKLLMADAGELLIRLQTTRQTLDVLTKNNEQ
ncbi:MAG TPA: amidohydrolase family protein [Pyrinomonadaceae bacterium]|jgi:5-methylthioadenosine/S-adenosylhomocysteine deaminase|nr:amidohydrolase family protein [Pyrinomonadaceae bacterium]